MNHVNKDPSRINFVNKNRQGKKVGTHRKELLIELYKCKTQNEPDLKPSKLMRVLSQDTGIGYTTVQNTVQKYLYEQGITQKRITRTLYENIGTSEKCKILQKIHSFWCRHKIPTLKNISFAINADPSLSSLSVCELKKVLKDLHFEYTPCNYRLRALTEKEDIVLWRRKYLEDIRHYRNEGRTIYYLQETWINAGEYSSKELLAAIEPSGEGKRIIVVHIGSVEGFVEGGLLCFESKKNTSNYHDHMNGEIFYEWFCGILSLLKENSVIVFDNVSYYSVENHVPTISWKKDSILKWFEGKGMVLDRPMVKFQLIEKVKKTRLIYDNYRRSVQEAINHNKDVLRLPPYHCQLSPMQLAWEVVVKHVKIKNCTSSKLDDVRQLLNDGVILVTTEMWAGYVNFSITNEDILWNLDIITDKILDETVTAKINLVTSSESSSD
ncbi:uncharacterized protein LOC132952860 isoform X2 [Metopolophium dirhodum]|uniref:uncharacterized protein LOC132952860 isoform X2 n=2 Tax=Metopolophium dirhodum TaxID=44670 RepID=UPI00298F4481|nr:uncharacterized protein LOC132952860 isoform X2 [Metopolophium dirhodum]